MQASGQIAARYHCPHKVDGKCAGTCNLSVATLEGARAIKIECDKLVAKLEAGSSDVVFLLKANDKMTLLSKYRKLNFKYSETIARIGSSSGGGSALRATTPPS